MISFSLWLECVANGINLNVFPIGFIAARSPVIDLLAVWFLVFCFFAYVVILAVGSPADWKKRIEEAWQTRIREREEAEQTRIRERKAAEQTRIRERKAAEQTRIRELEAKERRERVRQAQRSYWLRLTGHQFEKKFAELLSGLGYSAKVTSKSGDGGIDINAEEDGRKIVIQCKHWKGRVPVRPVRELNGVRMGADAWLMASGGLTRQAAEEARKFDIKVLVLEDVLDMVDRRRRSLDPPLAVAPVNGRQAKADQETWTNSLGNLTPPVQITNSLGMKLNLILPGEFAMGSPASESGRDIDETQHLVKITKPFTWASMK